MSRPLEVLSPREVPLGGQRAMTVRRTLPQRQRSFVGAWCFVDHYGPNDVAATGGMSVPPHPHTGLQTVSWLFSGEVEHRDSAGHHAFVRPGELNLMTAGRGISHSEYSTPATTTLHGAQLWVALPRERRGIDPTFEHYAPEPVTGDGWEARVFLGNLLGATSPVTTHSPLLGAEVRLSAGTTLELAADPSYELGVLVDHGELAVDGKPLAPGDLGSLAPGDDPVRLEARQDTLALVLGGPPFGEEIVMWWNFVGTDHDEVAAFRADWQSRVEGTEQERFATYVDPEPPLPAPILPNARLMPRGNRG